MLTLKITGFAHSKNGSDSYFVFNGESTRIYEAESIVCSHCDFQGDENKKKEFIDDLVKEGQDCYGMKKWEKADGAAVFELTTGERQRQVAVMGEYEAYVMNEQGATIERFTIERFRN